MDIVAIDFETEGIVVGASCPPKPIGVAIKEGDGEPYYMSFGHVSTPEYRDFSAVDQRISFEVVKKRLKEIVESGAELLFHNAKFDLRVMKHYFGIEVKDYRRIHDTMLLLFLYDPNQKRLGLKESAERLLGINPDEKEELQQFMLDNQETMGVKISSNEDKENYYMRMLKYSPPEIVGKYACNDVEITYKLFEVLHPAILGMEEAYDRERELLLNLMSIEEVGVKINVRALRTEINLQSPFLVLADEWVKCRLGNLEINLNSTKQVCAALIQQDLIDVDKAHRTKTDKISVGADSLKECIKNKEFLAMFIYRTRLINCLNTFMIPWEKMASKNSGKLHTTWHQTACSVDASGKKRGARTGRLSSSPNFQNQPKQYKPLFLHENPENKDLPICPVGYVRPMPIMRSFITPRFNGHTLIDLDYSQQEIRIMAHFEDGTLLKSYKEDPNMDVHKLAIKLLKENLGKEVTRGTIKIIVFSILYGKGPKRLSKELKCSLVEAETLVHAYYSIFPGVRSINKGLKEKAAKGLTFKTLGGRVMKCEPPVRNKKGELCDLSYKMINTLIQGSAGDATKMAINNYMRNKPENHHLLLTVHDEILCSVPKDEVALGYKILKEAMESVPCDVLLLAEGKDFGAKSWDLLK